MTQIVTELFRRATNTKQPSVVVGSMAGSMAEETREAKTTDAATVDGAAPDAATVDIAGNAGTSLCVFVDIGGNRELESLAALLPFLQRHLPTAPRLIAVKSSALAGFMEATPLDDTGWEQLAAQASANVEVRRRGPAAAAAGATPGVAASGAAAAAERAQAAVATNGSLATTANATAAASGSTRSVDSLVEPPAKRRKRHHPKKMPLRNTAAGVPICRYHNYSEKGCVKFNNPANLGTAAACIADHTHW